MVRDARDQSAAMRFLDLANRARPLIMEARTQVHDIWAEVTDRLPEERARREHGTAQSGTHPFADSPTPPSFRVTCARVGCAQTRHKMSFFVVHLPASPPLPDTGVRDEVYLCSPRCIVLHYISAWKI